MRHKAVIVLIFIFLNNYLFAEINKKEFCEEWSELSFILKPSPIAGVGVFATHDICAGTILMCKCQNTRKLKTKDIPAEFLKYCIYINKEECLCPERFDRMEIGWFINHSSKPNIALKESASSDCDINNDVVHEHGFYALTNIKVGDEILLDYNSLKEPEDLKDGYYKKP